ncbi:flavin monoamine oxidase family protein [Paenactinomyces guangxiensis]|uniref:Flavin monoamine oxidase family protein n=1 Tax=Paenactinomyces guangxiensis TaxID=1490290 RepID=A0A7W2A6Y2_9BACL|nr:flavin monoamine oxidase family protein [Paenactinomyces guangxiensis]MBH8591388.1 flavin monoamine oxidase family protein [Paenactinomyces guangxiensis]
MTILEATERVGGRVLTIRSPFKEGGYIDVGPMRIPNTHYLTMEYIRKFHLPINPFINTTPNDIFYVNGVYTRRKCYEQNPSILNYPVAPRERNKTASELLHILFQPIYDFINQNPARNWPIIIKFFDKYSFDIFLTHNPFGIRLSHGAIEQIKVISANEGMAELSFLDIFREYLVFLNPYNRFYEITGGNDQLPKAFLPQLKENILFNQELKKIVYHESNVTFYSIHTKTGEPLQITGDCAIVTIPFSVLRFIEVEPYHAFSHSKRKAIRELHYVPSIKTGIQFRERFWEKEKIFGGQTITDLPIRQVYYPSHGFGQKVGVILTSYTWEDSAQILQRYSEKGQIQQALENLAVIHGLHILNDFVTGVSHSWTQYKYATDAFAFFKPEQEVELYPSIIAPEGRIHFAGEHASSDRTWIQGAIESGIRAAYEVNSRPYCILYIPFMMTMTDINS